MAEPATAPRPVQETAASEAVYYHRFTQDEYFQMVESGILGVDDHTELLHGYITELTAQNAPHFDEACTIAVADLLPGSA